MLRPSLVRGGPSPRPKGSWATRELLLRAVERGEPIFLTVNWEKRRVSISAAGEPPARGWERDDRLFPVAQRLGEIGATVHLAPSVDKSPGSHCSVTTEAPS